MRERSTLLWVVLILAAIVLFLIFGTDTFAQEPDTRVDLDPFIADMMPYIVTLFGAIVSFAVAWMAKKASEWTGIQVEAKHREALQSALTNGAKAALAKFTPKGLSFDVKSVPLAEGIEFVLRSVPDAVEYFGLDEQDLARHLQPKLVSAVAEAKIAAKPVGAVG